MRITVAWRVTIAGLAALAGAAGVVASRDDESRDRGGAVAAGCLAGGQPPGRATALALFGDTVDEDTGRLRGPHVARLLRVAVPGGEILDERRLGRRLLDRDLARPLTRMTSEPGSLLAASPGGAVVAVLLRAPPSGRGFVAIVDATTLRIRCRFALGRGVLHTGIELGRSGRLYVYGYRPVGPTRPGGSAVLTVLDATNGDVLDRRTVRAPTGPRRRQDWVVFDGALSADEQQLVLTYHGGATTGADLVDLRDRPAGVPCTSSPARRACVFEIHGSVAAYGSGYVATTGSHVVRLKRDGRVFGGPPEPRYDPRNHYHLMDFALDAARSRLYISHCARRPVLLRRNLRRDRLDVLPSGRFCGTPMAFGAGVVVLSAARANTRAHGWADPAQRVLRLVDAARPGRG